MWQSGELWMLLEFEQLVPDLRGDACGERREVGGDTMVLYAL